MKKQYDSPEFELTKFNFENLLEDPGDGFGNIRHSGAQDIGEGEVEL